MDISKHEQTLYTMTDVTTNKIIIQVCHNNVVNLWLHVFRFVHRRHNA